LGLGRLLEDGARTDIVVVQNWRQRSVVILLQDAVLGFGIQHRKALGELSLVSLEDGAELVHGDCIMRGVQPTLGRLELVGHGFDFEVDEVFQALHVLQPLLVVESRLVVLLQQVIVAGSFSYRRSVFFLEVLGLLNLD
jgi:hypothetical protein